jgi:hypothetical protein
VRVIFVIEKKTNINQMEKIFIKATSKASANVGK